MKAKEILQSLKILALGIIGCLLIGFIAFLAITNPFYENDWLFGIMELICFVVQAVACGVFGVFLAKYSYKGMTPKDAERKIISYKYITIILIILFAVYLLNREMYRNFSDVIMYAGKSGELLRRTFNPVPYR